jgi:Co/Zn/Cd efflux system component
LVRKKLSKEKASLHQTFDKELELIAAFVNASTLIIVAVFFGLWCTGTFNPHKIESGLVIWYST